MTHADLVARAAHYLSKSVRCSVVVWRKGANCVEEPDAIGWNTAGFSVLIECKTSRADFQRDTGKWHRRLNGVGNRRFFLTPPGLIQPDELPELWGLLECHPATIRTVRLATFRPDPCRFDEVKLLVHWNRGRYPELPDIDSLPQEPPT